MDDDYAHDKDAVDVDADDDDDDRLPPARTKSHFAISRSHIAKEPAAAN